MNVYLIQEDGESFCIAAKSMHDATHKALEIYLKQQEEEDGVNFSPIAEERYYQRNIIQSCSLIGELKE